MRIYKTRADFTKLQAAQNPSIFAGTVCTITDEALNPMYVFQGGVWNNTVTAITNPITGKVRIIGPNGDISAADIAAATVDQRLILQNTAGIYQQSGVARAVDGLSYRIPRTTYYVSSESTNGSIASTSASTPSTGRSAS